MPINIPTDLPARGKLEAENIFVISEEKAKVQDIRPLRIAIVNLMPTKIATETQLLRLLGNTPVQVDITLVKAENHVSKNTSADHLERFYTTYSRMKDQKFDGMIITGAPVEKLPFEEVGIGRSCRPSWTTAAPTSFRPYISAGVRRPGCTTTSASTNASWTASCSACFRMS